MVATRWLTFPLLLTLLGRASWPSPMTCRFCRGSIAGAASAEAPFFFDDRTISARDGFRFSAPRLVEEDPRVLVAEGYDFANLAFVCTDDGLVALDSAATRAHAAASQELREPNVAERRGSAHAPVRRSASEPRVLDERPRSSRWSAVRISSWVVIAMLPLRGIGAPTGGDDCTPPAPLRKERLGRIFRPLSYVLLPS